MGQGDLKYYFIENLIFFHERFSVKIQMIMKKATKLLLIPTEFRGATRMIVRFLNIEHF